MAMLRSVMMFVLGLALSCQALNYTDLGPRNACEMPPVSLCAGIVNYKVPSSIARLTEFIELVLTDYSTALSGNEQNCYEPARRAFCKQVFPACSVEKNTVSFEADTDCASKLEAGCSVDTLGNINRDIVCSSQTFELAGQSCQALSSYSGRNLGMCNLALSIGSMELSDWMLHHIEVIGAFVVTQGLQQLNPTCFNTHWHYLCSFGECNGDRIHSRINTQECYGLFNCYTMDVEVELPCNSLTEPPPTTEAVKPTWPPFVIRTFDWSSSSPLLSNFCLIVFLVIIPHWLLTLT